jgi:hypothetical protein
MVQTIIERAFDLARSSDCRTMADIYRQLTRESYEAVHQHLSGAATMRQLRQLMRQNHAIGAMRTDARAR